MLSRTAIALCALCLAACGPPGDIELSLPSTELRVGDTAMLSTRYLEAGKPVSGVKFVWSSSNDAVLEADDEGRVYAVAPGAAEVTATARGAASAPLRVSVLPRAIPPKVTATAAASSAMRGENVQFQATFTDENGAAVSGLAFEWTSSQPAVAAIDASGRAAALTPGQTLIRARVRGVDSAPVLFTVVTSANDVASVSLTIGASALAVGQTAQLTAVAKNHLGQVLTGKSFTFSSSAPSVASVSAAGLVTAAAAGSAQLEAVSDNVKSEKVTVTVTDPSNSRTGTFVGSGSYSATGRATLRSAGALTLEFGADFFASSGPDVDVFLSTTNTVGAGSVNLGDIKATSGAQSYPVPVGVTLTSHPYVVLQCVRFSARFGYAQLQ